MSTSNASSSNETIIFKDEQHATNISEKLLKFYKDEELFDIILTAGNDCIKIQSHKIILSASSEYFLELFRRSETILTTIEINQIESSSLKLIIDYMYSSSIELSLEKIELLLRGAVFLKMKNLIDGCCGFLKKNLNTGNCLRWLNLSQELGLTGLQDQFLNYIYTNFEEATKETEFLLLDKIDLKNLLFNNNTHTDLEEQVFLSLVDWIEYDRVNRQHLLLELLSMVRYHFLTAKFIIENSKSVEDCPLILRWLRYHLSPESRTDKEKTFIPALISKPRKEVILNQDVHTVAKECKKVDKIGVVYFNSRNEIEIKSYNQELKTWSLEKRSRSAHLLNNISKHSLIVIDEKLYVVGGIVNNEAIKNVKCIDLTTFQSTDLPPMRVARCGSQLANLNGHLCVFGGFEKYDKTVFIDSVEIFNTSTQKWNDLQPLHKPSRNNKITGHNGILYIFDFCYGCLQSYDVSTDKWISKEQPIDDDVKDLCITGVDGFLYAVFIGDTVIVPHAGNHFPFSTYSKTSVKRFDLSQNSWSEMAALPKNKDSFKMVTVYGNTLLILKNNASTVDYNLDTQKFTISKESISNSNNSYIFHLNS